MLEILLHQNILKALLVGFENVGGRPEQYVGIEKLEREALKVESWTINERMPSWIPRAEEARRSASAPRRGRDASGRGLSLEQSDLHPSAPRNLQGGQGSGCALLLRKLDM